MKWLTSISHTSVAWIAIGILAAVAISSCGSSSPSIHVQVLAPADGSSTSSERVTVRGTVTPNNATVQVAGESAQVGEGVFTTSVPLQPGSNQLDVVASAPGGAPVSTTVAVTREGRSTAHAPGGKRSPSAPSGSPASSSSPVASTPAVASSSSVAGSSPEGTDCGGELHAGQGTSCAFAENVRNAYNEAPGAYLEVYSPVTNQTYTMDCTPTGAGVNCSGANNATVSW
jgi:Glucodextranase, domain B